MVKINYGLLLLFFGIQIACAEELSILHILQSKNLLKIDTYIILLFRSLFNN